MSFDPQMFLDIRTETALETARVPFPEGDWKALTISSIDAKPTKNPLYVTLILGLEVEPTPELQATLGKRDKYTLTARLNVEITAEGAIAGGPNTNIELGQLREAVNLNHNGMPFAPRMLHGTGPFLFHVSHRANPNDPRNPNVDVHQFTPVR